MRIIRIVLLFLIIAAILVLIIHLFRIEQKSAQTMFLKTSDNVKIAANLYEVKNPKGWLLLIHMMPAVKESWNEFAAEMRNFGYESLAIDLRGHGESEGGLNDYQNFSDAEHQASINDLEAGWEFLKSQGATPGKTTLIGASIGANLSLQFIAKNLDFKKAVLLSAGLNYRGIKTKSLVQKLKESQSVLFVTSKDDGDNVEENRELYESAHPKMNKHLIIYEKGGHGTNIFQNKEELDLTEAIKKFLEYGQIN